MRSSTFAPFVALVASVSAITITWPNTTDTNGTPRIDLSVPQTITWDSVSNDPTSFKIELVSPPKDSNTAPTQTIDIASSVTTSDDKYIMQPPAGLTVNETYQLFFYGPYNATTTGVIAESQFFIAAKVSGASAATGTTGGSTASPTSSTTTVTPSHKNAAATLRAVGIVGVLTGLAMLVL